MTHWSALRHQVSALLASDSAAYRADRRLGDRILVPIAEAELLLPAQIGDYTDFYASVHHATNVGACSGPTTPSCPITNGSRSAITAGLRRSWSAALRCAGRGDR